MKPFNRLKDECVHNFEFSYIRGGYRYLAKCTTNYLTNNSIDFKIYCIMQGKREVKGNEYLDHKDYIREQFNHPANDFMKDLILNAANKEQYTSKNFKLCYAE